VAVKRDDNDAYLLQINGDQAAVIARALDFYARIGAGQLEELLHHPAVDTFVHAPEYAQELIVGLKAALFGLPATASRSILSATLPESLRVAWDIAAVLRRRADEKNIDDDPIMPTATRPLPLIDCVTTAEEEAIAATMARMDMDSNKAKLVGSLFRLAGRLMH
jgi:hypothetical protein